MLYWVKVDGKEVAFKFLCTTRKYDIEPDLQGLRSFKAVLTVSILSLFSLLLESEAGTEKNDEKAANLGTE